MRYAINLVRTLRSEERQSEIKRVRILTITAVCLGVLVLAIFYSALQVATMLFTLADEQAKLSRIEAEYKRYKQTSMTINKADIEMLNNLQANRIFWTKKIAAMAQHLPENYWITDFGFAPSSFDVKGYGYITDKQKQLVTIDDYLNLLRADSTFDDVFKNVFLNATERKDEQTRERVSFDYSAVASGR
jgi:Tfp pilus assembly protein PilN